MLIDFDLKEKIKELKKTPKDYFDLSVAFWLINPDEREYTPEYLSRKYLYKDFSGKNYFKELQKIAEKKLKEYKLEKLFFEVEMPLLGVLADMEMRGIKIDIRYLKNLEKELNKKLIELTKNIYKEAGGVFNINSPKQLGQVLFQKLKIDLKGVKKTRGGKISTDFDTLLAIRKSHKIVDYLIDYRELFKLQSTYVRPLQELADKNNHIHTTYIQTGTTTGRLSSQNPNLQNIPIEGDWGKKIRNAFVAEKDFKLVSFDYSQIELRILASLSGDPKMMEAFNNDLDIHKMTAANVFNVPLEKVKPEMRRLAKTLNFGVVYGMGPNAFAKTSGLSVAEAKKFIEEYFSDFKKIKEWQEGVKAQARTSGFVTNLNGRRRWLLQATSMFQREAAEAERAAINMPVQGLAADILKMAMVEVYKGLRVKGLGDRVRMLLTIHDELLFEISEDIIKEAVPIVRSIMEKVYELEVPVKVDVKIGENWGMMNS